MSFTLKLILGFGLFVVLIILVTAATMKPIPASVLPGPQQTQAQILAQSIQDKYRGDGKTITVRSCVQQSDTVYVCLADIPNGTESLNVTVDGSGNWVAVPGN